MQPVPGLWRDIEVGSYIKEAATGVTWKVQGLSPTYVALVDRTGQQRSLKRPAATARVTYLVDGEHGVGIVERELGGIITGERGQGEKGWRVPKFGGDRKVNGLRGMRSHLFLMHNVYAEDVKTFAGLVEAHDAAHEDDPWGKGYTHIHKEK